MVIPVFLCQSLYKGRFLWVPMGLSFALLILLIGRAILEKKGDIRVMIGVPMGLIVMGLFFWSSGYPGFNVPDDVLEANHGHNVYDFNGSMVVVGVEEKDDYLALETKKIEGLKLYCNHYIIRVYNEGAMNDEGYGEESINKSPYELIGRVIYYDGKIEVPKGSTVPGGFDYREYLYGKGICGIGIMESVESLKEPVAVKGLSGLFLSIKRIIMIKREGFIQSLNLEKGEASLLKGILFGEKDEIDEDTYEGFRLVGTAHILAVSGLHIGIIYMAYKELEKRFRTVILPPLFLSFLLIYGTAALWSPSVTRAILLVFLKYAADLLEVGFDRITALAFCFVLELTIHPFGLFSTGLQMSFLATLGIFHLSPLLERWMPKGVGVVMGVQLMLFPYMMFRLNSFPFMGLLANIPILFFASPLVIIGVIGFSFYFLGGAFIGLSGTIIKALLFLITSINSLFQHLAEALGGGGIGLSGPGLAIYYFLIILLASEFFHIHVLIRKDMELLRRLGEIFGVLVMISLLIGYSPFNKGNLIFLDVGQGDALHIDWGRTDILIDGGGRTDYDYGKNLLKPYLLKRGERNIDLAIATHLDADHYKGLKELKECFPVKEMKTQGKGGERIIYSEDRYIDVLWPLDDEEMGDEKDSSNDRSMVLRIFDRGVITLVTGDISAEVEKRLIEIYGEGGLLKCHILKVAHHGSRFSTSEEFLDYTEPLVAVISLGKNNYGHPSPQVIEKLKSRDIMIMRTDIIGSIGIIVKENRFILCTKSSPMGLIFFSTI